jgi:anti-sigma regulatory factor (Ser/Thr protein kinase)
VPIPKRVISLDGSFASADLDRLLTSLEPLGAIRTPTALTIDLRRLERVSAAAAAVLVSRLLDAESRGVVADDSRMMGPASPAVDRRLKDLDVLELLVRDPPGKDPERRRRRGSRPCQHFVSTDDPGAVAQSLTDAISEVCEADQAACHAIRWALNEIAQNVIDHAASPSGGVGIAEVTRGGTELEVVIVDCGIGIRSSLRKRLEYQDLESDLVALRTALLPDVSTRIEKPGGLGLYATQHLLQRNGGGLVVRSGTAQLEVGATFSESIGLAPMHGTLVTLRFRTDQLLSLDLILPELVSEE